MADGLEDVEEKVGCYQAGLWDIQEDTLMHSHQFMELQRKLEDLDNWGYMKNLHIWNIPETVEQDQFQMAIQTLFNKLLEHPSDTPIELERAHYALRPPSREGDSPRDITCSFVDFKLKEQD